MKFHPNLAPYKVAVFPLMKKPDLTEQSDKILADLKKTFRCTTDDAGSIGKRYRRQDEIGTPFGVTVDFDTSAQNSVTLRHRDSMTQERINLDHLTRAIQDHIRHYKV
jgi:glycyl-tRNA synthetase